MRPCFWITCLSLTGWFAAAQADPPRRLIHEYPMPLYELRVMQASPGKLYALHARIRDHQILIMEQHGLTNLAVFVPAGENPNELVLLVFVANALGGMVEGL